MKQLKNLVLPEGHIVLNEGFYERVDMLIENNQSFGFMFTGIPGSGKSNLGDVIAKSINSKLEISEKKMEKIPLYELWSKFMKTMSSNYSDKSEQLEAHKGPFCRALQFIDDLGSELAISEKAPRLTVELIQIMYDRYKELKEKRKRYAFILTTNLKSTEIRAIYGDRIYDRLMEMFEIVVFPDKSFRTQRTAVTKLGVQL